MELASMLVRVGITGVSTVESGLSRVDRAVDKTASKGREAGIALEKLQSPLLSAAGAAGSLLAQVTAISAGIMTFSGVGVAARFQRLEQGFANILGNRGAARDLIEDLRKMGASTEFNTEELTGFARLLLATGSTAKGVRRELAALADASAFVGGNTGDVGALAVNLSQIRQAIRPELEDLKQFGTRGISLGRVVGAATGEQMDTGQAIRRLQSMNGQKAFETILTGMEKAFGGSAIRNAGTLLGVVQNINEAFSTAMLPTGKLLVPVLTSVAMGIKSLGEGIKNVNDATGGTAGLVVLIGGLWKGATLLTGTISGAVTATRALTLALAQYSGVAMGAAGASAAKNALNPFAGAAAMGPVSRLGGGRILAGNAAAAAKTGFLPALAGFGKSALGKIGGGPAAFIASLGLGFAGSKVGGPAGGALSGIGSGMGIGSLGFLVNPVVGAITTVAGGIIGGIKGYFDAKAAPKGNDPAAQDMKKAADSLRNIELHVIGGGRRAQRVRGEIEIEAAMGRIFATGIG
jgi:hypothetical protein